jgi:hypothetical protein
MKANIKMKKIKSILIIILLLSPIIFTMTSCKSCGRKKGADLPPGTHCVGVIEVIQTSNYTYLQVEENDNKFWIAVVSMDAKSGDVLYYRQAYEMKNFTSKELGRTFPVVFFVQDPSNTPPVPETQTLQDFAARKKEIKRRENISIEPIKGGTSIANLYKNKTSFSGKTVKIRGFVVRYNKQIMNKNWVHIQDGTDFSGKFDLAVTTLDSVEVGNTVTFTGIIHLDKDFGYGYAYDVIMEEAKASDIVIPE